MSDGCVWVLQETVAKQLDDVGGDVEVARKALTERAFSRKKAKGDSSEQVHKLAPGFFRGRGRDGSLTRTEIEATLLHKEELEKKPERRRRSLAEATDVEAAEAATKEAAET